MATQPPARQHSEDGSGQRPDEASPFGANAMRLSLGQWSMTALIVGMALVAMPRIWQQWKSIEFTGDERIPYSLSEDYWFYERHLERSTSEDQIVVLGDSVIWGEYVAPDETLSHFLSERTRDHRFANGGLNGTHPLALAGLVRYYGAPLVHKRVVLQCNLLWMSSPERDLSVDKELAFNHPQLIPQFTPWIPCYRASFADRMGFAFDRSLPIRGWVKHLRFAYFDGQDLPRWSLEHPYDNPLTLVLNSPRIDGESPRHPPVPWYERGIDPQDFPWVEPGKSQQWRAFRETVACLRNRGSNVFVLLGPLNEHLLTTDSRRRFQDFSQDVRRWLEQEEIPYLAPVVLPSAVYADTSHPLRAGYEQLAGEIHASKIFKEWLSGK